MGGGISGLAAAHRLLELAPQARIKLFEASGRLGGVISTVHREGYQIEQSADNFITTVPHAVRLCQQLGLEQQLVETNPHCRRTFVVRNGRLHKLPDGFLMMAPTRLWPLALTPILSPLGKLRAALEYFVPPRRDDADESMAAFVRRRLGTEVFQRLVEPLVSAVYAADMEKLSVLATLPRFREMERRYGSLIRAMRAQRRLHPQTSHESGARYSMFVTLRHGLSVLVDALADRLPPDCVCSNTAVVGLHRTGNSWAVRIAESSPINPLETVVEAGDPQSASIASEQQFDAVILAVPSYVAARLLAPVDSALSAALARIEYSGTAVVSLGFQREQIEHPLDGMGAVTPAVEHSPILAISFSSQKYPHRAPPGHVLLRVFLGGARRPTLTQMPDEELLPLVLGELSRLLGIRGQPQLVDIAHWPNTMPQYHVGHKQLVAMIDSRLRELRGLALAGSALSGVGIPDCIGGGRRAAESLLAAFGQHECLN